MSIQDQTKGGYKLPYQTPMAHKVILSRRVNLLEKFSAEADFEDFEDGGEL